jgi:hypothetical protein
MNIKVYQLLKITVFNLLIVSFLGVIMRYKIAFYFPFLEQKHLQEAHSHFAFYGWISSAIYLFIHQILQEKMRKEKCSGFYNAIIINFLLHTECCFLSCMADIFGYQLFFLRFPYFVVL